jgi:hypothetical protein
VPRRFPPARYSIEGRGECGGICHDVESPVETAFVGPLLLLLLMVLLRVIAHLKTVTDHVDISL